MQVRCKVRRGSLRSFGLLSTTYADELALRRSAKGSGWDAEGRPTYAGAPNDRRGSLAFSTANDLMESVWRYNQFIDWKPTAQAPALRHSVLEEFATAQSKPARLSAQCEGVPPVEPCVKSTLRETAPGLTDPRGKASARNAYSLSVSCGVLVDRMIRNGILLRLWRTRFRYSELVGGMGNSSNGGCSCTLKRVASGNGSSMGSESSLNLSSELMRPPAWM
jgi:hypothetical protein